MGTGVCSAPPALADGFIYHVSPDGRLLDTAETASTLRSFSGDDDVQNGPVPDRLFLFVAPQSREDDEPFSGVTAAAAVAPRAVRASPEILHAIETTALRYGSHDALRQAGLSVTDWALFYRANIEVESAYNPGALSPVGAIGLGQLMPDTARDLGVDPHDLAQNLDGSARYLLMMLEQFGDSAQALAAYNAGPHAVIRHGGIPPTWGRFQHFAPHNKIRKTKLNNTVGIDTSKATLDPFRMSDGRREQFSNEAAGLNALRKWLGKTPVRVIYEPTGPYHRDLEQALAAKGHGLVKVNPTRARRFAQATGQTAKTDRVDADLLARMGAVLNLEASPARSEALMEIKELHVARVGLIKDRTACRDRLATARCKVIISQLNARYRQIKTQIAQIDAELVRYVKADPELTRRYEIFLSIPRIGQVAAIALIVEIPELGSMNAKEVASLAGLAPFTRQSGMWKGKARISGGRQAIRTMLFMPALIATRFNAPLRQIHEALIGAGKPWKVSITAVMRKLVILANALVRDDRTWADARA